MKPSAWQALLPRRNPITPLHMAGPLTVRVRPEAECGEPTGAPRPPHHNLENPNKADRQQGKRASLQQGAMPARQKGFSTAKVKASKARRSALTQGDACQDLSLILFRDGCSHVRGNEARGHCIAGDIAASILARSRLCQANDTCLATPAAAAETAATAAATVEHAVIHAMPPTCVLSNLCRIRRMCASC
jgi:hypothetical protein